MDGDDKDLEDAASTCSSSSSSSSAVSMDDDMNNLPEASTDTITPATDPDPEVNGNEAEVTLVVGEGMSWCICTGVTLVYTNDVSYIEIEIIPPPPPTPQ